MRERYGIKDDGIGRRVGMAGVVVAAIRLLIEEERCNDKEGSLPSALEHLPRVAILLTVIHRMAIRQRAHHYFSSSLVDGTRHRSE